MNTTPAVPQTRSLTLDEQLQQFRRNPFLATPLTGMLVWVAIGLAGYLLPPEKAVLAVYLGTGMIFYLALGVARLLGEDMLGRKRRGNFFDRIFLLTTGMSLLSFSFGMPFGRQDPTAVPLFVGIATGLMWLPFSAMAGHWVGYFHALARTLVVVAVWYLFPSLRFVLIPAVIVAVYAVSLVALRVRWQKIVATGECAEMPQGRHASLAVARNQ